MLRYIFWFPVTISNKARFFLKKNGPIVASFCLFLFFSRYNCNNTNWKKHRWCTWDSNPGLQDGGCRQNHRAKAATLIKHANRTLVIRNFYFTLLLGQLWGHNEGGALCSHSVIDLQGSDGQRVPIGDTWT